MINPDKGHKFKGTVIKLGPSWLYIQLKTGAIIESELMDISGYNVGDHVSGEANYGIVGECYVARYIKLNKGRL
jgi:hypothetical protein